VERRESPLARPVSLCPSAPLCPAGGIAPGPARCRRRCHPRPGGRRGGGDPAAAPGTRNPRFHQSGETEGLPARSRPRGLSPGAAPRRSPGTPPVALDLPSWEISPHILLRPVHRMAAPPAAPSGRATRPARDPSGTGSDCGPSAGGMASPPGPSTGRGDVRNFFLSFYFVSLLVRVSREKTIFVVVALGFWGVFFRFFSFFFLPSPFLVLFG